MPHSAAHTVQGRDHVLRVASEHGRLEMATRAPIAPLHAWVRDTCCYDEARRRVATHRHLPHPNVTFIVSMGGDLTVHDASGASHVFGEGRGFLAGLHTRPALTESGPCQRGVQISLTPLGAHLLLGGVPMHEVTNRVFDLAELLGADGRELGARLCEAPDTDAAFAVLETFFQRHLLAGRTEPPREIATACQLLEQSRGTLRIGAIGERLGWSRKRLVAAFREKVGLPPKTLARILRFDHAMELLKRDATLRWSDAAAVCGYADQAHLSREVRDLAGATPGELARHVLPESGGITADSRPGTRETK